MKILSWFKFRISLETAIAVISAVIAIAALVVSQNAIDMAEDQFRILNQGYIQIKPAIGFQSPFINRYEQNVTIGDEEELWAMDFSFDLQNIGNLPVAYNVKRFDVFLADTLFKSQAKDFITNGAIYPKEETRYHLPSAFFLKNHGLVKFKEIKKQRILEVIEIEYNDLSSSHKKFIRRKIEIFIADNVIQTAVIEWEDSI
jgi:hypothetical protein